MTVAVELAGTLNIRPVQGTVVPVGSNGCGLGFENPALTKSATAENGSASASVASPADYVALPIDSDMRGVLLYIQQDANAAAIDLQLTLVASGVVAIPQIQGVFIMTRALSDAITGVAVRGTSKFVWQLTGSRG